MCMCGKSILRCTAASGVGSTQSWGHRQNKITWPQGLWEKALFFRRNGSLTCGPVGANWNLAIERM